MDSNPATIMPARLSHTCLAFLLAVAAISADEIPCSALFSDLNADYVVTAEDFFILADEYGQRCVEGSDECGLVADLNADGLVGLLDVFMLTDQIGMTCDPDADLIEFDELRVRYFVADMHLGGRPATSD